MVTAKHGTLCVPLPKHPNTNYQLSSRATTVQQTLSNSDHLKNFTQKALVLLHSTQARSYSSKLYAHMQRTQPSRHHTIYEGGQAFISNLLIKMVFGTTISHGQQLHQGMLFSEVTLSTWLLIQTCSHKHTQTQ